MEKSLKEMARARTANTKYPMEKMARSMSNTFRQLLKYPCGPKANIFKEN